LIVLQIFAEAAHECLPSLPLRQTQSVCAGNAAKPSRLMESEPGHCSPGHGNNFWYSEIKVKLDFG
jgi:hypothetical protein